MSLSLSDEERRDIRMTAADAQQILQFTALQRFFEAIRETAVFNAIHQAEHGDRETARMLVKAIDTLRQMLHDAVETAKKLDDVRQRSRAFE